MQGSAGSQGYLPMPVLICPGRQARDTHTVEPLVKQLNRGICQSLGFSALAGSHTRWGHAKASSLAGDSRLQGSDLASMRSEGCLWAEMGCCCIVVLVSARPGGCTA